jgi:hypothetical protein
LKEQRVIGNWQILVLAR